MILSSWQCFTGQDRLPLAIVHLLLDHLVVSSTDVLYMEPLGIQHRRSGGWLVVVAHRVPHREAVA